MKKFALLFAAVVAMSVFCVKFTHAADDNGKSEKITGVLIDDHCAGGMMKKDDPQAAAEGHKVACANKCIKGGASVVLISGKDGASSSIPRARTWPRNTSPRTMPRAKSPSPARRAAMS